MYWRNEINDSLNVNKDIKANGDIISLGEMVATDTLRAKEDVVASKDIKVEGSVFIGDKLNVSGQSFFEQEIIIKKGLLFDNVSGISYGVNNGINSFNYGRVVGSTAPTARSCAAGPQAWANHQFGGLMQIYDADAAGQYVPNSGLLNFQTWSGGSSIDASIGGALGGGGLLLNYFCHNNTAINTGWDLANNINGGRVSMGAEVEMMRSLKIGYNGLTTVDANTAIEINQNTNNAYGVNVKTYNNSIKAFCVLKPDGSTPFEVYGDGHTKTANLNIVGDATVSNLAGTGNRNIMADATGKLIAVAPTPIGSIYSCTAGSPQWSVGGDNMGAFAAPSIGTCDFTDFVLKSNNVKRINLAKNGKIYFGATKIIATHLHANSQYQFDGKVSCKELVVVDPTKWADFVFDKTYNLIPLNEVETFYLKNKHLPCIPSEAEVKENGINTAEMDALLLQKIEELTLYIVQQQKDIEELKKLIKK